MTNKDGVLRKIKHVEFQKRMKNLNWNTKASQIKDNDLDKRGSLYNNLPCSYQCRSYRTRNVGSTPPVSVAADWESGGIG